MDERWELDDLYEFARGYSQSHSFIYCFDSALDPKNSRRIDIALEEYPWQGGYSYVNIYNVLHNQIPIQDRPRIASIQYASPGWIDMILNPEVALQAAKSVGILVSAGVGAVEAFKRIDKARLEIAAERKRKQAELASLSVSEAKSLIAMSEEIAKYIGFENLRSLNNRTKDPEVTLKLLLAHYRRLRVLGDYVENGKISLPNELK